jgi:hypothetical protein
MIDPTDIRLDDIVKMRKTHPCGGDEWRVVRLGTDIGMICLTCRRKVYLPRSRFARQVKKYSSRGPDRPDVVQG